jgi:hypothetical protein
MKLSKRPVGVAGDIGQLAQVGPLGVAGLLVDQRIG